jgi:hypothetical protein
LAQRAGLEDPLRREAVHPSAAAALGWSGFSACRTACGTTGVESRRVPRGGRRVRARSTRLPRPRARRRRRRWSWGPRCPWSNGSGEPSINLHIHALVLDGVFARNRAGYPEFSPHTSPHGPGRGGGVGHRGTADQAPARSPWTWGW